MKTLASETVLAETQSRLRRVTPEDRPGWGRMSAVQMVEHLSCAYDVALGDRMVTPISGPPPWLLKLVALRSGLRWPQNTPTTPELLVVLDREPSAPFAVLVEQAVGKMESLASGARCQASHPMFGRMSAGDWNRWGYLHADHHLRQFGR